MDKKSAVEILINEAETSEALAVKHCERGDHAQAAWRFEKAGDYYRQAGQYEKAAYCFAQSHAEGSWLRRTAPTNISALVD